MKKILPVLIVLLLIVFCLTAVTVVAADPGGKGKHGVYADGELDPMEDFRGGKAQVEGEKVLFDGSLEDLGIIQLTR